MLVSLEVVSEPVVNLDDTSMIAAYVPFFELADTMQVLAHIKVLPLRVSVLL